MPLVKRRVCLHDKQRNKNGDERRRACLGADWLRSRYLSQTCGCVEGSSSCRTLTAVISAVRARLALTSARRKVPDSSVRCDPGPRRGVHRICRGESGDGVANRSVSQKSDRKIECDISYACAQPLRLTGVRIGNDVRIHGALTRIRSERVLRDEVSEGMVVRLVFRRRVDYTRQGRSEDRLKPNGSAQPLESSGNRP